MARRGWDYQSNVAMGLAKRQALQSRDIAATIVDRLGAEDLSHVTIGGPVFAPTG